MAEANAPMSLAETLAFYRANGLDPMTGRPVNGSSPNPISQQVYPTQQAPQLPTPVIPDVQAAPVVGPNIDQAGPIGDVPFDAMPEPGSPAAAMANSRDGSTNLDGAPPLPPIVADGNGAGYYDPNDPALRAAGFPPGVDPNSTAPIDPNANTAGTPYVVQGMDRNEAALLAATAAASGGTLAYALATRKKKEPSANSADKPGDKFGIDSSTPKTDPRAATPKTSVADTGYTPQKLLPAPSNNEPKDTQFVIEDKSKKSPKTDDVIYASGTKEPVRRLPPPSTKQIEGPSKQKALPAPGPTYPSDRIYAGPPGPEYIDQKLLPDLNAAGRARAAEGYKQPLPELSELATILANRFRVAAPKIAKGAKSITKAIQ